MIARGYSIFKDVFSVKTLHRIRHLSGSAFFRNVLVLVCGTASAQIITLLCAPIITRLYSPEAFGTYGTFVSLIGTLTPLICLSYPVAMLLPKEEDEARAIAKLSLIVAIAFSGLSALIVLSFWNPLWRLLDNPTVFYLIVFSPLFMLISAWHQITQRWLMRLKQFSTTSKLTITQSIVTNAGKILVGMPFPNAYSLISFNLIGQLLQSGFSNLFCHKKLWRYTAEFKESLWSVAKRYRDFPVYRTPDMVIIAVSQSIPVILLTSFYGAAYAGYYVLARSVLTLPANVLGKTIGDVFYTRISDASHNHENLHSLILRSTLIITLLGLVPFVLLFFISPWLFQLVFGQEWQVAGEYGRWIAIWVFAGFINTPASNSVPVLNLQRFTFIISILAVVFRTASFAVGIFVFDSHIISIALYSLTGAILNNATTLKAIHTAKHRPQTTIEPSTP